LFLLVSISFAVPYNSYTLDFTIVERKVVGTTRLIFTNRQSGVFYFPIPADASTIDKYLDTSAAEPVIEEDRLKITLRATKEVGITYVTSDFLDKNNFLANFKAPDQIKDFSLQVTLPEKASLRKPIIQGELTSGSIHPLPDEALTDGRSMIFVWKRADLNKDDELSVFTQYKPGGPTIWTVLEVILVLLLLYIGYTYMKEWRFKQFFTKSKKKEEIAEVKKPEKELEILKHLKEDEQQIIRILKQKEGQCEQGTLRIITDFSKAHLSRLLMELEARHIIHKEKKGKKNIVFLKKE
jgi:hypothetical protein